MWVVLGLYGASLARIWIIEIVDEGLERSTSEGIKSKWGTPLRVVTPHVYIPEHTWGRPPSLTSSFNRGILPSDPLDPA